MVVGRRQWIYIKSQMGGRSDIKNVNTSYGGSFGYIPTLSSDIPVQAIFCGQGPSELDHGIGGSRINREERLGQYESQ